MTMPFEFSLFNAPTSCWRVARGKTALISETMCPEPSFMYETIELSSFLLRDERPRLALLGSWLTSVKFRSLLHVAEIIVTQSGAAARTVGDATIPGVSDFSRPY